MTDLEATTTDRLILRRWRSEDQAPFAQMNADAKVMAFLPKPLSAPESNLFLLQIEASFDQRGYGLYALELKQTGQFIGFTGLWFADFEAAFTPAVEIGWRLARPFWGCGYATEAAHKVLHFAFDRFKLKKVVSFTTTTNQASTSVMRRIGLSHQPKYDFDHPALPNDSPLKPHVLYSITKEQWDA